MSLYWFAASIFAVPGLIYSAPLPVQVVDLSHVLNNNTLHWPTSKGFEIYVTSNGTYNNLFWMQAEDFSTVSHIATHIDAPCHFAKGAWAVDDIPLERLVAPAAVVDITDKAEANRDYEVTIEDLTQWEEETGCSLDETIVLIRSGWSKKWFNRTAYFGTPYTDQRALTRLRFPGVSTAAAQWLVDNRKIYGLGTEMASVDPGTSTDFSAHQILNGANIFGIENMNNLDELPIYGAKLYAMPMKVGSASGAPARVLASFPMLTFSKGGHSASQHALRDIIMLS